MRNALFDDIRGMDDRTMYLGSFAFGGGYDLQISLVDGERLGVHWRLWDETVWQRNTEDSCDESRATEEEEVPVETAGFLEWVCLRLGC